MPLPLSFYIAIGPPIATATVIFISIPTDIVIAISIDYLLFAIATATPIATATAISIAIPTDISISIAIDYLLFNNTLIDYN